MALADALRTFMYISLWGKPVISVARGLNGLIKSLFMAGEVGFAYDPNDLTTLYQDAAGTIPVTAAGQPVGLMLDKSKELVLGPELYTGGEIQSAPIGGADFIGYSLNVPRKVGVMYVISFSVKNYQGTGNVAISGGTAIHHVYPIGITGNTSTTQMLIARTSESLELYTRSTNSCTFYNISVKELSGNHAYQTTSASRPLLQRNATTGAYYLAFDGTDDFLETNSINFTATDKISLFAGVRKLSAATVGTVAEFSIATYNTSGSFGLFAPSSAGGTDFMYRSSGTLYSAIVTSNNNSAPKSAVLTGISQISTDTLKIRVNGQQLTAAIDQGSGNYGNHALYIGRREGKFFPFNGHIYSLIGIGRLTTDSETIALEKSIAKNTGVTLSV